jgi:hypothetical protein
LCGAPRRTNARRRPFRGAACPRRSGDRMSGSFKMRPMQTSAICAVHGAEPRRDICRVEAQPAGAGAETA